MKIFIDIIHYLSMMGVIFIFDSNIKYSYKKFHYFIINWSIYDQK
jgi:hypothetical protein